MTAPVRIANCSGFYGDRLDAAREQLEGGEIDYLTGDYLAELTMAILVRTRQRRPDGGYAASFLAQMEQVLGPASERGVRIVTNAGGLNPAGLAARLRELIAELGLPTTVAHLEGDDVTAWVREHADELTNLDTAQRLGAGVDRLAVANAYLGSWGIVEALATGADVVVCPRVTDAAVTVGPAAFHHGWRRDDWDRLAAATVAGHVLECGCQATGGNLSFFDTQLGVTRPGFPIAEIDASGGVVITKHPGTGGRVSRDSVTAQLLYEIGGPRYLTPDVTARFDTVTLADDDLDRVRISGVRGEPPPLTDKVCLTLEGGYRNAMTFLVPAPDVEAKARLLEDALWPALGGRDRFATADVQLLRTDQPDATHSVESLAQLRVVVLDDDRELVARRFPAAAVELGLASYPGYLLASPPGPGSTYAITWPTLVATDVAQQAVVDAGGWRTPVPNRPGDGAAPSQPLPAPPDIPDVPGGPRTDVSLGTVFGARSGDKGGIANIGVWGPTDESYAWLAAEMTADRVRELLPETADCEIECFAFPRLRAVNIVVHGLLGPGAAASTLVDSQAKSLAEFLRTRVVRMPLALLPG